MRDQFATSSNNIATTYALPILSTQEFVWDPEYRRVVQECWNKYVTTHNRQLPWLRRYMPDPPPDLLTAARGLDHLAAEVHEIAEEDPKLAEQIDRRFGGHLLK